VRGDSASQAAAEVGEADTLVAYGGGNDGGEGIVLFWLRSRPQHEAKT
jgi:hypothetical protein